MVANATSEIPESENSPTGKKTKEKTIRINTSSECLGLEKKNFLGLDGNVYFLSYLLLVAPRTTLGHYWGDSSIPDINHCVLYVSPEGPREPPNEVRSQILAEP